MRISSSSSLPLSLFGFSLLLLFGCCPPSLARRREPAGLALLSHLASNIPVCAYGCINQLTNVTADAERCLREGKEEVCLCDNDVHHYLAVLACVQKTCTMEESMETARGAWEACGKPQRSRKKLLWGPLSLESLAVLCVFVRLYSRRKLMSRFEVDDYVMMVVVALYFVFLGFGLAAAIMAYGVDLWTVGSNALGRALEYFYISESFYIVILALTKISILCFYLCIFPNRWFRIVTYITMFWIGVASFIFVLFQVFQCVPIGYIWEGWRKGKFGPFWCLNMNALTYTMAGFNISQEIFILLMPIPLLINLNVARRSKVGIIVMFSLGGFVVVISCVRLWAIYRFGSSINPTWDYTDTIIWTGLEVAVSIIVTSLPAIRALLGQRKPKSIQSHMKPAASTSSFGDTTFVGSWGSAPPHLKRISTVSRISSINADNPAAEDVERQESHIKGGDRNSGALVPPSGESCGSCVSSSPPSGTRTMVRFEDEPERVRYRDAAGHQSVLARDLRHMPSIDEIMRYGKSLSAEAAAAGELMTKASASSYSSMRTESSSPVSRSSCYESLSE